jgi:GAF domain-containing protein
MQFTNAPLVAPDLSPLPANEAQRLQALWTSQLLDTPPEPDCDALVRLAAQTLRMPMAWMALADADRLWFKARMGFDMAEMPRAIAPCAHTLLRPEQPLLVSDLTQDNRFAAQPCVLGAPHWRSYAGVALVNAQGHALGTLAVASPLPCAFSLQDAANLHDLGLLAQDALDKRRLTQQLIHMTLSDPLTGLSNRNAFHQALQVELAHAMRCGEPFSVLCMDLDGFKAVNEGFARPLWQRRVRCGHAPRRARIGASAGQAHRASRVRAHHFVERRHHWRGHLGGHCVLHRRHRLDRHTAQARRPGLVPGQTAKRKALEDVRRDPLSALRPCACLPAFGGCAR